MIVLNSVFPVFALIVLGKILKNMNITNESYFKTSDKLIYYIFLPTMLFWKIGGASSADIKWELCYACLCAVFCIFILSTLYILIFSIDDFQAGSFSQSCFRFNTYIGLAIIVNALGDEGIRQFGIMIGFIIPFINILCVSVLIWFSEGKYDLKERLQLTGKSLFSNPLIIACFAGLLYSKSGMAFPLFIHNTLKLFSSVTLPLALVSIGGSFTFEKLQHHKKLAITASVFKLILLPIIGYIFLIFFNVTGVSLKVGMIFFTLPTSTAIYVLSSQLNSDTDLAAESIVISTMLSFITLSITLLIIQKYY